MIVDFNGDVTFDSGKVLEKKKISELTNYIIEKFAVENLSIEEADVILENTKNAIRGCSIVQKTTSV